MEVIKGYIEDNALVIALNGHIDSSNAADVEKEINQLRDENTFENVYLDAENLEYISSAGLRIILRLRKNYSELKIMNVHPDVYEILDMTGFTEMIDLIILKSQQGVYVRLYLNDYEKHKNNLKRLMDLRTKYLRVFDYQKQDDDAMAASHAKTIVVDEKELLVSSANLSYHGMQGNVEMGIRLVSPDKAQQIEGLLKEMVGMKVFKELRKD